MPTGGYLRKELLPPDAQKKTEPITHARVLHLLRRTLTDEDYTELSRSYADAIVADWLG